ncbi:hypothetical protein TNCV_1934781 [Trichonephila clavipes]|nr:hypothetical protein TNCV_1934781 [Trichonephila clavipes]
MCHGNRANGTSILVNAIVTYQIITKPDDERIAISSANTVRASRQRPVLQKHVDSLDPRNIRDFIDSYLVEMKSQAKKKIQILLSTMRL